MCFYLFFQVRLPPEVNRVLYVRNLPYKITAEEMYDIFGKYGAIRQIRVGNTPETRGTAFVVYEDIFDAKNACDHLSGKVKFSLKTSFEFSLYFPPCLFIRAYLFIIFTQNIHPTRLLGPTLLGT